jgi:hypothetical protein
MISVIEAFDLLQRLIRLDRFHAGGGSPLPSARARQSSPLLNTLSTRRVCKHRLSRAAPERANQWCSSTPSFVGFAELLGVGALLDSLRLVLFHEIDEDLDFLGWVFGDDVCAQGKGEVLSVFGDAVSGNQLHQPNRFDT